MLSSIQPYVTRYANVIAKVTGINVEVADSNLVRLAGTGMYASEVGKSISDEGEIYRNVMRTRETFFLETPREHPLCRPCPNRSSCKEALLLCTPILDHDSVAGVIGMVCFTEAERRRVLANKDTFIYFLEQIAELLSHKLSDRRELARAEDFLDLMMQIVDVNTRGIIVFDASGGVTYLNTLARKDLGIPRESRPVDLDVRPTGSRYSDLDEFEVKVGGRRIVLVGKLSQLPPKNPRFARVLAFDPLSRITQRISEFTTRDKAYGIECIVGTSEAVRRLKEQIRRIAGSTSTVLITGETGTGKELVARAIHSASDRKDKPFIAINCGAIPETLLESELFGYSRGAFTGADPGGKIGKFELANHGVLFLDEVSSLPIYLQVKLLRVLQERQFCRVGSNRLIDADIRIIAATNENLPELIEQGRFRTDLYYRLNVIPLETPPLRERPEDIEVLAQFFLDKYCDLLGKPRCALPPEVLEVLRSYRWPGNVRELENAIEFMVNMMPGSGPVHPGLLPPKLLQDPAGQPPPGPSRGADAPFPVLPFRELERRAIAAALRRFGTDYKGKRRAAEALGIGIATLYRKIKEYGLGG